MRKAFDANVPKLKPRLRTTAIVMPESPQEKQTDGAQLFTITPPPETVVRMPVVETKPDPEPVSGPVPNENRVSFTAAEAPEAETESDPQKEKILEFPTKLEAASVPGTAVRRNPASLSPKPAPENPAAGDAGARRERLEKVKRKVAEAARTEARIEPVPEDPAQAAESVLGLVSDLEGRLSRTRDLEKALRSDLTEAKNELARAATEGRAAAERLVQAEAQLDEKRKILEEMLVEMNALEEERDQTVRRVQLLTAQDEERQKLLDDVERRCAGTEKALSESQAEEERLSRELDESLADSAQLRAVLSEVTRDRDALARTVEHLTRERDELTDAKKALEKVHQALAQARARLGN
jgi:chromosome segregation ATPase